MEKLPAEMLLRIFDTIFEENPVDLYRCRAVCRDWKTSIDQYIPALYKKWDHACARDIPKDCIDNIIASRFPLAASPWVDSYWRTAQLPDIPRAVHKTWKNLQQFDTGEVEVTKIVTSHEANDEPSLYCGNFAINDKYLAVTQLLGGLGRTEVYQLADMTRPIGVCPLESLQIDFYTVNDREFIILDPVDDITYCVMWEFLKSNEAVPARFEDDLWDKYLIVENEFFTYRDLHFVHYLFSDGCFKENKRIRVPQQIFFNRYTTILELRIYGSELQVIVGLSMTDIRLENVDCYDRNLCICRYNISRNTTRSSRGNLIFFPHTPNFIQRVTHHYFHGWISTGKNRTERRPIDIRLYPIRFEFVRWLNTVFANITFIYFLTHGDRVFAGTQNGRIFIFHHWTVDEMIRDFTSKNCTVKKRTEINLYEHGIHEKAIPIGVAYTNSKLRIIVKPRSNDYYTIDFPLKF